MRLLDRHWPWQLLAIVLFAIAMWIVVWVGQKFVYEWLPREIAAMLGALIVGFLGGIWFHKWLLRRGYEL